MVVDASAAAEYVLGTDLGLAVGTIFEAPDSRLNAPALCDVEVCSIFRRMVRLRDIDVDRATAALADYLLMPLRKHGHRLLVERIFELRDNFTSSDAAYVALCERLGATFVTCDGRLTRAARDHLTLNVIGVTA